MRSALPLAAAAIALAVVGCRKSDQVHNLGSCDTGGSTGAVPHRELALRGELAGLPDGGLTLRTAEERLRFQSATGVQLEAVDFDREQILVAAVRLESTCGLRHDDMRWQLTGGDDTAHLELQVTNPDGTCSSSCDMDWVEAVAVAVPAQLEGSACAVLTRTCAR
jgi:hypothetical protein